jgi:hypothetical protein
MPRAAQRADFFRDTRLAALDVQCQQPIFTNLERGQGGRGPTAILTCDEIRQVLSPAGGVRERTRVPTTIFLRVEKQEWVITAVTSQLFKQ